MVIVGCFGVTLPSPIVVKSETLFTRNVMFHIANPCMYITAHQKVIQNQPHVISYYPVFQTCHCHWVSPWSW